MEFISFWNDEKTPADITLYSNIVIELRHGPDVDSELLRRFAIGQGITPESEKEIRIEVPGSETQEWPVGSFYRHLRLYSDTGRQTRAHGIVQIQKNLVTNEI